ncbi:MAG: type II secretion system GspH family protein [Candidatus Paracaedibacteraceae bacterium]|nr:type II secretion system GspH family protein [Candidatus Paracaedibacteraceae bacterium]
MTRRLSAFSLIEISIALIIMGIVASMTIPLLTVQHRLNQQKTTHNHEEQIVAALAAYVLQYHRLPAPAPSSNGKANKNCENHTHCVGFVPFTTLGLPEKTAKDGYGNWFTFAVHPTLTKTQARTNDGSSEYFCKISAHIIKLQNLFTNQNIVEEKEDPLAFILISHGKKGGGALTDTGSRLPAQGAETKNSQGRLTFVEGQAPDFDHQIYWITRDNFMALHAKNPCTEESRQPPQRTTPAVSPTPPHAVRPQRQALPQTSTVSPPSPQPSPPTSSTFPSHSELGGTITWE